MGPLGESGDTRPVAAPTGNPERKSENALVDEQGRVYVTSGDAYGYQGGSGGVVWRVTPRPE
jgi:hypothetical protein